MGTDDGQLKEVDREARGAVHSQGYKRTATGYRATRASSLFEEGHTCGVTWVGREVASVSFSCQHNTQTKSHLGKENLN